MATNYGAKDVGFFLVGGRDIVGAQTTVTIEREALLENTTPLGTQWETWQATGQKKATITQDGFYDAATDAANDAICGNEGTSQVVCIADCGNTRGNTMIGLQGGFAGKYTRKLDGKNLHKASATYTVTGNCEDVVIVKTLAAVTADGNSEATSVDGTAGTAAGGAGYLQVSALSLGGYTNIVVKVRHSTDNVTFVDLLTFTAVTAAPAAERKTVAGNVYRYLAESHAFTGAGGAHSATFTVGVVRFSA